MLLDKFGLLLVGLNHPFSIAEQPWWLILIEIYASLAVEMLVAGFFYFWIMEPDWRKAGATAWLLFIALHLVFALPPAEGSLGETFQSAAFYAGAAVAFAAAMFGARWGDENHTNLHIKNAIDSVLGVIGL